MTIRPWCHEQRHELRTMLDGGVALDWEASRGEARMRWLLWAIPMARSVDGR